VHSVVFSRFPELESDRRFRVSDAHLKSLRMYHNNPDQLNLIPLRSRQFGYKELAPTSDEDMDHYG
jgi:hypothetical protein